MSIVSGKRLSIFKSLCYLSSEKGAFPLLIKLNCLYTKIMYAEFGLNSVSGFGEIDEHVKSLKKDSPIES